MENPPTVIINDAVSVIVYTSLIVHPAWKITVQWNFRGVSILLRRMIGLFFFFFCFFLRGPALCIDLLMQHSLCLKWEFASDLNQLSSGQKTTSNNLTPRHFFFFFFVTYIKGTAEYADKKKKRKKEKRNGKPAELVQSVMNILSELLLILLRRNWFRLHRNWCGIKTVVEDFKCFRRQPLWWIPSRS